MYKAPTMTNISLPSIRFCDDSGCVAVCGKTPAVEKEQLA